MEIYELELRPLNKLVYIMIELILGTGASQAVNTF